VTAILAMSGTAAARAIGSHRGHLASGNAAISQLQLRVPAAMQLALMFMNTLLDHAFVGFVIRGWLTAQVAADPMAGPGE